MKKKVLKSKDLNRGLNLKEKVKKGPSASKVDVLTGGSGQVLNKKIMDAKGQARSIIEDSQADAERIRKEAEGLLGQVAEELEKAKSEGYKVGHEEGLSSVTEQIMEFEKMKEEFYKNAEENIIKLTMTVAEKVIGKMVHEHGEAIKSIVKQALEKTLGEKIIVRLNPEDYKVVTASESEFSVLSDKTKRITFKEDEGIDQGGCVVETEVGTIDARLETQLKAIRKALEL